MLGLGQGRVGKTRSGPGLRGRVPSFLRLQGDSAPSRPTHALMPQTRRNMQKGFKNFSYKKETYT